MKMIQELKEIADQLLNKFVSLLDKEHAAANSLQKKAFLAYSRRTLTQLVPLLQEDKIRELKDFLTINWAFINGTALSYTALPNDSLTVLFCDIAQYIHSKIPEKGSCALKLLMPTLVIEPEDDLAKMNIQVVLRTHILGQEGQYLVPVERLCTLINTHPKEWNNYYYDYKDHPEKMAKLTEEEFKRLTQHSAETNALLNAQKQYELCINQKNSLLAHLWQLNRHLYFNSAKGIGKEENAGSGAYDAIIKFNEYFTRLDKDTQAKIPPAVKREIDLLLNLASNKEANINATSNLNTCIAIRRETLTKAIEHSEVALSEISLDDDNKAIIIAEKKKQLEFCKDTLSTALKMSNYCGHDALGLTRALMRTLNITYSISSLLDIQEIMKLSTEEFAEIYDSRALQSQLIAQLKDIETLVLFIHETPIEKLQIILTQSGMLLAHNLIKKHEDITALLYTFNKELCELIVTSIISSNFLITSSSELESVLAPLSYEQRLPLCKAIKRPGRIFAVKEFTSYLETYFPDNAEKRRIQRCYFNDLLDIILFKSTQFKEQGFIAAHNAATILFNDLTKASLNYFEDEKIKLTMKHAQFKKSCEAAIKNADELRNYRGWIGFLIELALCVASFGIIPLILSTTNKLTQGTWKFRLFNTQSANTMDQVLDFAHEVEEMISEPALN